MRILGACRLSRDSDESTSIERQREQVELTCKARGWTLVGITADPDISGAVRPSSRPELGPWLTDSGKIQAWDGILVVKLDRLTRSLGDFIDFYRWCEKHGKQILTVEGDIDMSSAAGRAFVQVLIVFAEFERERMAERRKDAARKARTEGRWNGGNSIHPGYAVDGTRFVQDDVYGPVVARMAQDAMAGHSLTWIARKLTEAGVAPRGGASRWTTDVVQGILTNPAIAGITVHKGRVVRGEDGHPRKFTDAPILDDEDWDRLQAALSARKNNRSGEHVSGFQLLRVAWCSCGQPLYGNTQRTRHYYRCRSLSDAMETSCGQGYIRAAELEAEVEAKVLSRWRDRELHKRTPVPAKDPRASLEAVTKRMTEIEAEIVTGVLPASSASRMLASLETEKERLEALPVEPARDEWTPAGITVADHWADLSHEEKGHALRVWGVRAMAWRDQAGELHVILAHGKPEGFEQASGLMLRHEPEDHEPLFEIAGVLFRRDERGVYEQVRDPMETAFIGAIRDRPGL